MTWLVDYCGLVNMIVYDKYDDLKKMYDFFIRVQSEHLLIRKSWLPRFGKPGKSVIGDQRLKNPFAFLERLIDERAKYLSIIDRAFYYDKTLYKMFCSCFAYLSKGLPNSSRCKFDYKFRK